MRIKLFKREAAAIIKLRRKGHSINGIATFLGRSTSLVHRILKFNYSIGALHKFGMRKLPKLGRNFCAVKRRRLMERLRLGWESWILGEEVEPP